MSAFDPAPPPPPPPGGFPPWSVSPSPFDSPPAETVKKKRSWGKILTIVLLSVALAGVVAFLVKYVYELDAANNRISEQNREIEEQRILIDKKETFGAAIDELLDSARGFDGALMSDLIPFSDYEEAAQNAWAHRWDGSKVDEVTESVRSSTRDLATLRSKADAETSTNSTGSTYETVIDRLGEGFVSSLIGDADTLCKQDVLACVTSDDPYTVHFDAASNALPYMNEWLRTGVAYHEFAHVLQFTNPTPTETALESFDGDMETMADCFTLTYLDGWSLDHRVWTSSYQYWDVNIGYGYTCNGDQRHVIKDWYGQLGFQSRPISQ